MPFACGQHRAFIYERGGVVPVGELTPLLRVRWERIRDEISTAYAELPTTECCELLGDLRTIKHELHIERNGEIVWQGPITRLEYQFDVVEIFAEDVLRAAKRIVLREGYTQAYPNLWGVIDRMDWLMRQQCYNLGGDPWNMLSHLHAIRHQGDPRTSRNVFSYQFYIWEDFDKYAEDSGSDYTVVNRDLYYWDTHLAWKIIPDLDEAFISQYPRIVEYGNDVATTGYVTNGQGQAGIATQDDQGYGIVDFLVTNLNDGNVTDTTGPTPEEIAGWAETAAHNIDGKVPAPSHLIIPANSTLMPGAPWEINDLFPGAWFKVHVDRLCRQFDEWQRLHQIIVTEEPETGETVEFTAVAPPARMVLP
jgi:hypothetical protein